MNASAILLTILALGVGALIGYLYASSRSRASYDARLREAETGRAALEATTTELRSQLEGLRSQFQEQQKRLESESAQRVATETALDAADKSLAEQRQAFEQTKDEMKSVFRALASEALSATTQQFLDLAKAHLESELEPRQVAIAGMVNPLSDALKAFQVQLLQVESARQEAYGELRSQVQQLANVGRELQDRTGTLASALQQPRVRGSWGELTLRRAVELAGMSAHCDFAEQKTIAGETRLRPDLTVYLPGGRSIAVDAKVPLKAFTEASEAASEAERQEAIRRHVQLVRAHIQQLGSKSYWSEMSSTPEFVVLFMPGESFFSAALESDRTLIEDAQSRGVILASPTTLIALLKAAAYGWQQKSMEENTRRIAQLGQVLYERIEKFVEHLGEIRKGLDRASHSYNDAVGSFNDRLLPSVRRLGELGVSGEPELAAIEPTEVELRQPPREDGANPPEE